MKQMKYSRKILARTQRTAVALLAVLIALFSLAACLASTPETTDTIGTTASQAAPTATEGGTTATTADANSVDIAVEATALSVKYSSKDVDATWETTSAVQIALNGPTASAAATGGEAAGVAIDGGTVTIAAAGTYVLSGTLTDGQIIVSSADQDPVRLVLAGANIFCSDSAPICIMKSDKTIIILAEGTTNRISDGERYTFTDAENEEPDAALFSKSDLTITGSGLLAVTANFNDGIASKDKLKVTGGVITIDAAGDGLKGRDFVAIKAGALTIEAGADGIQATNDEDMAMGFISIEGGSITVTAEDDAINARNALAISGGNLNLSAGDDGMHADASLAISGGSIDILQSYEGIESETMTFSGGTAQVTASDDGLNGSGGTDNSSVIGRTGQSNFANSGSASLTITGGYLAIDANGDGIDINGPISMSAGTVLINGPTADNNGALDYSGSFSMSGGLLVAAGSSGMAEMPDESSTQYVIMVNFDAVLAAGTLVRIETSAGEELLSFSPVKACRNIVLCSPALTQGLTGTVYSDGSTFGSFSISGIQTIIGTRTGGMFPGGNPGGGPGRR